MKQPNSILKLAVLASSVLLVSGFVAYRAGAFHWFTAAAAPADPASNLSETDTESFLLMGGSKDMVPLIDPSSTPGNQPSGTPPPEVIFGGSKSAIFPLFPQTSVPPAPPQPAPAVLPGPKRAEIFIPSDLPGAQPPAPSQQAAPVK